MKRSLQFLSCLAIFMTVARVLPLQAQEATPAAVDAQVVADQPAEGSIREQQTTTSEQAVLQTYYRDQMEAYRSQEKKYQVAQKQLKQLNTLAALEEAVQATKQVMITRDQVLQTYFKLLRLKLIDTHGVPILEKTTVINELSQLESSLKTHETNMDKVTDRFSLAQKVTEFTSIAASFDTTTYHALSLITFGNMQTVYDKTVSLFPEVEAKVKEQTTDFELAKKQRALAEVNLLASTTKSQLNVVYSEVFTTQDGRTKVFSSHDYAALATKLQTAYAQISQMHEFIDEVMKL